MKKVRLSDLFAEDQKTKVYSTTLETPFEITLRGHCLEVDELEYEENWFDDEYNFEPVRDFNVKISVIKLITMEEEPCEVIISDNDMYVLQKEFKDILWQNKYNES